jgi:hypothetical protein
VKRAHLLSSSSEASFVRREDLLNPDLMSEVILLAAGVLLFVILLLIVVAAVTHPALI